MTARYPVGLMPAGYLFGAALAPKRPGPGHRVLGGREPDCPSGQQPNGARRGTDKAQAYSEMGRPRPNSDEAGGISGTAAPGPRDIEGKSLSSTESVPKHRRAAVRERGNAGLCLRRGHLGSHRVLLKTQLI